MRKRKDIEDDAKSRRGLGVDIEYQLLETLLDIRQVLQEMHLEHLAEKAGLR